MGTAYGNQFIALGISETGLKNPENIIFVPIKFMAALVLRKSFFRPSMIVISPASMRSKCAQLEKMS